LLAWRRLLVGLFLVSCGGSATTPAPAHPSAGPAKAGTAEETPEEAAKHPEASAAEAIVEAMGAGAFAKALEHFTESAHKTVDEASLREAWDRVARDAGGFKSIDRIETVRVPGFTAVKVRCLGKTSAFEARVTFGDAESTTLATAVAVTPAWDPPPYADASRFHDEGTAVGSVVGSLALPVGDGPFPAAVLLPASGPLDHDGTMGGTKMYRDIACGLASRGVATVRYDRRSKGDLTLNDDVHDAMAALALLKKNPKVDKKRIYLVGHDEGGRLAPLVAERDRSVAGLALLGVSPRRLEDQLVFRRTQAAKVDGAISPEEKTDIARLAKQAALAKKRAFPRKVKSEDLPLGLPPSYWASMRTYDPLKVLHKVKTPALFIQGDRDFETTAKDLARWKKSLASRPHTDFKSCAGCNHHFVTGSSTSDPADYDKPANVSPALITDLATFTR
jgi:pimeloyl-ACP methyl ester carboxylesterase